MFFNCLQTLCTRINLQKCTMCTIYANIYKLSYKKGIKSNVITPARN